MAAPESVSHSVRSRPELAAQLALSSELAQTLVAVAELADERVGATELAHIARLDEMRSECRIKLSSLQVFSPVLVGARVPCQCQPLAGKPPLPHCAHATNSSGLLL